MKTILYTPEEVWGLFESNKSFLLTKYVKIAENTETEIVVWLTAEQNDVEVLPSIVVFLDDAEFYSEEAINPRDCEQTVTKIYYEYLDTARLIDHLTEKEPDEYDPDLYGQIEERENELSMVVEDFVDNLLGYSLCAEVGYKKADEIREDLLDHICEYLHHVHEVSVYRPMVLVDDKGNEFISEFPYEDMEYDDKDILAYLAFTKP